jgi:hypothetical protein
MGFAAKKVASMARSPVGRQEIGMVNKPLSAKPSRHIVRISGF